jgi:hypothetical protein
VVAGFGEPAAEHGGEAVGVFDVGQVPAVGEHRQPAVAGPPLQPAASRLAGCVIQP